MAMIDLHDQVAVVTGGSAGIGRATAVAMATYGAHVAIADIDGAGAAATADLIGAEGGHAIAVPTDVSRPDHWVRLADEVADRLGPVSTLVNNAFHLRIAPLTELEPADWDAQLAVNLTGVYHGVRTFARDLTARCGSIVNVSSVHARLAFPGHPAYAATKGAIIALSQQLAVDLGPAVRVNTVLPGPILTRQWDGLSDDYKDLAGRETALLRLGRPDEVATAICFLASDAASYITAASLVVDGGYTVRKDPAGSA
ncbi:SDR family oxidoreductase [soil metagenome]